MLARLVYTAFNIYALGLIVYAACTWVQHPTATKIKAWLHRWYDPLLASLRRVIKPVQIGTARVDFAPWAFLAGILIARQLVVSLFVLPY